METASLSDGTDFTSVEAPSLSDSEYEMVSNADIQSESIDNRAGTRNTLENEPSITRSPGNGPNQSDGPSRALTLTNMTLKDIDEVGGIRKYQQMMVQDMKLKQGSGLYARAFYSCPRWTNWRLETRLWGDVLTRKVLVLVDEEGASNLRGPGNEGDCGEDAGSDGFLSRKDFARRMKNIHECP